MAASEELVGNGIPRKERNTQRPPEHRGNAATVEEHQKAPKLPALPVFWDGTPGTLNHGMVCREGKLSVSVAMIVHCINGTVIVGTAKIDGRDTNVHVTNPTKHPLADLQKTSAQEAECRKLWEYDQL